MRLDLKGKVLAALFAHWPSASGARDGYTILLPSPMDMPFLLQYALEGLRHMDTTHCNQILVVPDGWSRDGGAALRHVLESADDPRLDMVDLRAWGTFMIRQLASSTHWMQVIKGIGRSASRYTFLHDADAFHLETNGIERQYSECRDRGLFTLGVTARWDPFFAEISYRIPGTWELMFSTQWARSRPPHMLKGRLVKTHHGPNVFDTMLYPQYLDYSTGKIAVMAQPPRFVHFSNTIESYRQYNGQRGQRRQSVLDECFRLLLLAVLETLIPPAGGSRNTPTVDDLARGLKDSSAPVRYDSEVAVRGYGEFRGMLNELCESPVFQGPRAEHLRELVAPFDRHFAEIAAARGGSLGDPIRKFRSTALG
jgi:hypothetical protein